MPNKKTVAESPPIRQLIFKHALDNWLIRKCSNISKILDIAKNSDQGFLI